MYEVFNYNIFFFMNPHGYIIIIIIIYTKTVGFGRYILSLVKHFFRLTHSIQIHQETASYTYRAETTTRAP
jgi:hypothetical protein